MQMWDISDERYWQLRHSFQLFNRHLKWYYREGTFKQLHSLDVSREQETMETVQTS